METAMFELNQNAKIASIKVAKRKGEETPVLLTVGLEFENVNRPPIAALMGCEVADLDGFFNDKGEARFTGITEVSTFAKYDDGHIVKMLGFKCDVSKISNITHRPRGSNNFDVKLKVQIEEPKDHVIEKLAANLHRKMKIKIEASGELPLAGGAGDASEAD